MMQNTAAAGPLQVAARRPGRCALWSLGAWATAGCRCCRCGVLLPDANGSGAWVLVAVQGTAATAAANIYIYIIIFATWGFCWRDFYQTSG